MTNNIIVDLSMEFAVSIVTLCDSIKGHSAIADFLNQHDQRTVQFIKKSDTSFWGFPDDVSFFLFIIDRY